VLITYSSTTLASSNLALGRVGPSGLTFTGTPLVDVAQFFRAANATVYGRGDGPEECAFSVLVGPFASEADALNFAALHRSSLPLTGTLTIVDDLGVTAVQLANAVREVRVGQIIGVSVRLDYKFTGSVFTSTSVPVYPTDTDLVKAINQALTSGTTSQAIAYDVAFSSSPRGITLQLSAPDGGLMFGWQIRESSRTPAGFTVDFDAAVPATGYKLTGIALL